MDNLKRKFADKLDGVFPAEKREHLLNGIVWFLKVALAVALGSMIYFIVMEANTRFNILITIFIAITSVAVAFFVYAQGIRGVTAIGKMIDVAFAVFFIYVGYSIFVYFAFWIADLVASYGGLLHGSIGFFAIVIVGLIFVAKFFNDSETKH